MDLIKFVVQNLKIFPLEIRNKPVQKLTFPQALLTVNRKGTIDIDITKPDICLSCSRLFADRQSLFLMR